MAATASALRRALGATSSSWLNLVERWFAELIAKRIHRGSLGSAAELKRSPNSCRLGMQIPNPSLGPPPSIDSCQTIALPEDAGEDPTGRRSHRPVVDVHTFLF